MSVMRAAWIVLAVVMVFLGIVAAASPMLQITDCEIGLYSQQVPTLEACNASIWSYFGNAIMPVLAVPVAVCLLPVFRPRQGTAWLAVAALFVLSLAGIFASVVSSKPTSTDLLGFFWPAPVLAALVTGLVHMVNLRRNARASRSCAP